MLKKEIKCFLKNGDLTCSVSYLFWVLLCLCFFPSCLSFIVGDVVMALLLLCQRAYEEWQA